MRVRRVGGNSRAVPATRDRNAATSLQRHLDRDSRPSAEQYNVRPRDCRISLTSWTQTLCRSSPMIGYSRTKTTVDSRPSIPKEQFSTR